MSTSARPAQSQLLQTPRIGVDLGGTKIEAVVVRDGGDRPDVLARVRVPTERDRGYEHVLARAAQAIADVEAEAGLAGLPAGVGMPGGVTFRGEGGARLAEPHVKNSNTTCLNGRPFRGDLQRATGRAIAFANDANCFALAEATWGAARGADVAFGVIMGTGVGGGVVLPRAPSRDEREGRGEAQGAPRPAAWDGAQGIAGEWGHVVLDPRDGPPCYCGKRGCVETYLSGPALERDYARRAGVSRALAEIAAREAEDEHARATIEDALERFGRALATVIDVLDPDVVVLGGGVSNLDALYDRGVAAVARWVFNDELRTRIVRHALGDSAGVLGAALL
jgi:fructokinase